MRIIVIGGAGTIGRAVVATLAERHDVVVAGRRSGAVPVDIRSPDSVRDMFRQVGPRVDDRKLALPDQEAVGPGKGVRPGVAGENPNDAVGKRLGDGKGGVHGSALPRPPPLCKKTSVP